MYERATAIILAILVFTTIIVLSSPIKDFVSSGEISDRQACKLSALSLSKIRGEDYGSFNCKTQIISDIPEDSDEQKKLVANELYSCWNIFGQGSYGYLFNNAHVQFSIVKGQVDASLKVETKCFTCSVLQKPENGFDLNDFEDYLKTHNPSSEDKSYYDILDYNNPNRKSAFVDSSSVYKNGNIDDNLRIVYFERRKKAGFGPVVFGVGVFTQEDYKKVCGGVIFGS